MHVCYSCGAPAEFYIDSVGISHRMQIWVCSAHMRGERILAKIENGVILYRKERMIVTFEELG